MRRVRPRVWKERCHDVEQRLNAEWRAPRANVPRLSAILRTQRRPARTKSSTCSASALPSAGGVFMLQAKDATAWLSHLSWWTRCCYCCWRSRSCCSIVCVACSTRQGSHVKPDAKRASISPAILCVLRWCHSSRRSSFQPFSWKHSNTHSFTVGAPSSIERMGRAAHSTSVRRVPCTYSTKCLLQSLPCTAYNMLPRASCPPLASRNALQLPTERSGTTTTLCNPQHARPTTAAPARVHHSAVPQQHCLSVHLARAPGVHAPSLPQPPNSSQLLPTSSRPFAGSLCDPSPLLPPPSILPLVPSSLCNASEQVPCAHVRRATSRARKAAPATQKHPNAHQPYISHTSAIHQPYIR